MPTTLQRARRLLAAAVALGVLALASADAVRSGDAQPSTPIDACGPRLTKPDGGTWTCSFVDEFEGSALDTDKWITPDTPTTGFKTGVTCYRGARDVAVRSGALLLVARDLHATINCDNPYGSLRTPYTGGLVGTRGHFSQAFGRFEVRAKYPTARTPGVHGGFWLYSLGHPYGSWPASGEIDVAEWWSSKPELVLPSLRYNGYSWDDSGWDCLVADASVFHTYAVEWSATEMRFFIDGTNCWTREWTPDAPQAAPQPFDHPFSIVLSMGVGTTTGTNVVSDRTELPATFTIDYVKVWK